MSQLWAHVVSLRPQTTVELVHDHTTIYYLECESPCIHEFAGALPHKIKAWLYPELCGIPSQGDLVLLNLDALELGLGTGGAAFVLARIPAQTLSLNPHLADTLCSLGVSAAAYEQPDPTKRIVKMRYSPHQLLVQSIEAQESNLHERLKARENLQAALPVICCELHSQAMAVALALRKLAADACIAYVMTDEGALAASYSQNLCALKSHKIINFSLTVGQAFGGDYEAVSLASACVAAEELGAELIIVAMGPGIVGTGSYLGTCALAQASALNTVACIGARSLACPRLSEADKRKRHRGVSHHSHAVFRQFTLAETEITLPSLHYLQQKEVEGLSGLVQDILSLQKHKLRPHLKHQLSYMSDEDMQGFFEFQAKLPGGLALTSMGRSKREDELFFSAPYAAALCASRLL